MNDETADIAVLVTKDVTDAFFTAEVIVNGKLTAVGNYATKQAALRFASFETIRLTKENNKGRKTNAQQH